jgi:hypothetical protein
MVTPDCSEPLAEQSPKHDWRQPQEIGPAPQLFGTHWTSSAPPALMRQTWPGAQVCDRQ